MPRPPRRTAPPPTPALVAASSNFIHVRCRNRVKSRKQRMTVPLLPCDQNGIPQTLLTGCAFQNSRADAAYRDLGAALLGVPVGVHRPVLRHHAVHRPAAALRQQACHASRRVHFHSSGLLQAMEMMSPHRIPGGHDLQRSGTVTVRKCRQPGRQTIMYRSHTWSKLAIPTLAPGGPGGREGGRSLRPEFPRAAAAHQAAAALPAAHRSQPAARAGSGASPSGCGHPVPARRGGNTRGEELNPKLIA